MIVDGDLAARAIGSEVGFVQTYLQAIHLLPAADASAAWCWRSARASAPRAALRVELPDADASGIEVGQDLPASERFFAGGDTTVRGFSLDRLGTPRRSARPGSRSAATASSC